MATLLDTSALVVLIRRRRSAGLDAVAEAARGELEAGRALVSAVTATELLVGARGDGAARLEQLVAGLPVVDVGRDVAGLAGRLGAAARSAGATIPLPDLLIAATATWLGVPLLTCDSDFFRGVGIGDDGGEPWSSVELHVASLRG